MKRHAFLQMILPPALYAEADRDRTCAEYAPLFGHDLGEFPTVLMEQMTAMKACDLTPQLSSLAGIPTLVVGAAHDRIARPVMFRALAAGIPGAELVVFSDAGHVLPIHDAAAVSDLLERHFCKINS